MLEQVDKLMQYIKSFIDINDFIDKHYWSSEEGNSELGWIFRCTEANEFDGYNPKYNKYFVRAVRTISQ